MPDDVTTQTPAEGGTQDAGQTSFGESLAQRFTDAANVGKDDSTQDTTVVDDAETGETDGGSAEETAIDYKAEYEKTKKSYEELRKLHGSHAKELGDLRKKVDQLGTTVKTEQPSTPDEHEQYLQAFEKAQPDKFKGAVQFQTALLHKLLKESGVNLKHLSMMGKDFETRMTEAQRGQKVADDINREWSVLETEHGADEMKKYQSAVESLLLEAGWKDDQSGFKLSVAEAFKQAKKREADEAVKKDRQTRGKEAGLDTKAKPTKPVSDKDTLAKMDDRSYFQSLMKANGVTIS